MNVFQYESCPYAETALRNDMRRMLNRLEEKHPSTKYIIFRSMEKIKPALEKLIPETKLIRCEICNEPTTKKICQACEILQKIKVL